MHARHSKFPLWAVRWHWHLQRCLLATFLVKEAACHNCRGGKPCWKCLQPGVSRGTMSWSQLQIFTTRALPRRHRGRSSEKGEGLSWVFPARVTFCDLLGTKYLDIALRKAAVQWVVWDSQCRAALRSPFLPAFPPPDADHVFHLGWALFIPSCAWFLFASEVPTAESQAKDNLGKLDNNNWRLLVAGQEGWGLLGVTGRSWGIQSWGGGFTTSSFLGLARTGEELNWKADNLDSHFLSPSSW